MAARQAPSRRPQRATAGGFGGPSKYTTEFLNGNGLGYELSDDQVGASRVAPATWTGWPPAPGPLKAPNQLAVGYRATAARRRRPPPRTALLSLGA